MAETVNPRDRWHLHLPRELWWFMGLCSMSQAGSQAEIFTPRQSLEKSAPLPSPTAMSRQAGEQEVCRKPAESMQESCRKQAGSTPHSLPEHLFYFHHSSFWQKGIKPYWRPQGEPGLAPAPPCHCSSPCSGWLCRFLPQSRVGSGCLLSSSVSPQVIQTGFICRRKPHE